MSGETADANVQTQNQPAQPQARQADGPAQTQAQFGDTVIRQNEAPQQLDGKDNRPPEVRFQEMLDVAEGYQSKDVDAISMVGEVFRNGGTLSDLRAQIQHKRNEKYTKKAEENRAAGHETGATGDGIDAGIEQVDLQNFSLLRAARAMHAASKGRIIKCHEMDVMTAANERIERDNIRPLNSGYTIPGSIFDRVSRVKERLIELQQRVISGGSGAGANLVETMLQAQDFINILRPQSVVVPRARMLPNLVGNVDIPRQSGTINAIWRDESDGPSNVADQDYDQVELRPKEMIVATTLTRRALSQATPALDSLTNDDLLAVAMLAMDFVTFMGNGVKQPQGVFGVDGGSRGQVAADTTNMELGLKDFTSLETKVAEGNALTGSLAYACAPAVRGEGKETQRFSGSDGRAIIEKNEANGFPVEVTTQITRAFASATAATGGTGDALFFGNWGDVLIGDWYGTDIVVNELTGALQNRVTISLHKQCDVALRHIESFAYVWNLAI